jgi:putative ATPase
MLVGMPECQLPLSQAVIYIATAPKSNASATAIWDAGRDVREGRTVPVPKHLRDAHYKGATRLGHGEGYQYAHNHKEGFVEQDYLGVDKIYYQPADRGYEVRIAAYLARVRGRAQDQEAGDSSGEGQRRERD